MNLRRPLRALGARWGGVLGAVCVIEDAASTLRSHRMTKAEDKQRAASERVRALVQARQGCTHTPPCPPAGAADRLAAAEVWADDACVYLCNGLVLSTAALQAPDSPSGLHTPTPERETTP